ncbi:hypothetical protein [Marinicrinis lubricantis]|uniref:Uncharacterized protein n=1 Tax=Marinicrinis lubricantis TaxID=2086470 RepID=A0ABW1IJN6_9BACL
MASGNTAERDWSGSLSLSTAVTLNRKSATTAPRHSQAEELRKEGIQIIIAGSSAEVERLKDVQTGTQRWYSFTTETAV